MYQFQSFQQYRGKLSQKSAEELAQLRECGQVWDIGTVLNYLQAFVDKSGIVAELSTPGTHLPELQKLRGSMRARPSADSQCSFAPDACLPALLTVTADLTAVSSTVITPIPGCCAPAQPGREPLPWAVMAGDCAGKAEQLWETEGYDSRGSNVMHMLGYFSLVGLQRVHALIGDYHTALAVLHPIHPFHKAKLFAQKVPGACLHPFCSVPGPACLDSSPCFSSRCRSALCKETMLGAISQQVTEQGSTSPAVYAHDVGQ